MIRLDITYVGYDFNLYDIVNRVKHDCVDRFDAVKEKFLLVTSDVILGPKMQTCFTRDLYEIRQPISISVLSIR